MYLYRAMIIIIITIIFELFSIFWTLGKKNFEFLLRVVIDLNPNSVNLFVNIVEE